MTVVTKVCFAIIKRILAKLDDGLDESPTVMVGEDINKLGKNRGILKPSWAFVETNNRGYLSLDWWTKRATRFNTI